MSEGIDGASVMRTPCLKYSEHDVKWDRTIRAAMKKHHGIECTNINIIHELYIKFLYQSVLLYIIYGLCSYIQSHDAFSSLL